MITERVTHKRWPQPPADHRPEAVQARWKAMQPVYQAQRIKEDEAAAREYERQELLDSAPSTDDYDYFEELGYDH
jgi:hypothetical protein